MRICLFLSFSFCGVRTSDFCFGDIQHFRCYAANVDDRDLYSHKAKQASDQMLVGWLVWLGAVLRVCPCVTYEFKSVSYHLIAKNQTQNLT